jgi:hypothetical protein
VAWKRERREVEASGKGHRRWHGRGGLEASGGGALAAWQGGAFGGGGALTDLTEERWGDLVRGWLHKNTQLLRFSGARLRPLGWLAGAKLGGLFSQPNSWKLAQKAWLGDYHPTKQRSAHAQLHCYLRLITLRRWARIPSPSQDVCFLDLCAHGYDESGWANSRLLGPQRWTVPIQVKWYWTSRTRKWVGNPRGGIVARRPWAMQWVGPYWILSMNLKIYRN